MADMIAIFVLRDVVTSKTFAKFSELNKKGDFALSKICNLSSLDLTRTKTKSISNDWKLNHEEKYTYSVSFNFNSRVLNSMLPMSVASLRFSTCIFRVFIAAPPSKGLLSILINDF